MAEARRSDTAAGPRRRSKTVVIALLIAAALVLWNIYRVCSLYSMDRGAQSDLPGPGIGGSAVHDSGASDSGFWVLTTFTDGSKLGEGMHLLTSRAGDGRRWTPLPGDPLVFSHADFPPWEEAGGRATVFRDPSITWHGGWFHLVFTTELCAGLPTVAFHCDRRHERAGLNARFGYARSRDLLSWRNVQPVAVPLAGACNVWAPEWFLLTAAEAQALALSEPPLHSGSLAKPMVAMVIYSVTISETGRRMDCPWDFGPSAGSTRNLPYFQLTADFQTWYAPAPACVGCLATLAQRR